MKEAIAGAKNAIAIVIGSGLIAGALIYQVHQRRYEVAAGAGPVGPVYRLDTVTGSVSACTIISGPKPTSVVELGRTNEAEIAGHNAEAIRDYLAQHLGEVTCAPWRR